MRSYSKKISCILAVFIFSLRAACAAPGDIVFVTQPPLPADFATINAVFGNQLAGLEVAPRGGDLYIRYSDGSLKNLTKAAGFGEEGLQGSKGIAVRDPAVHWDGTKVLFSMVIGAPKKQYEVLAYRWQLYEITGLGKNDTPVITKVPNQPTEYNNVMAVYGSDEAIIFASDRPRDGQPHLYPQLDEYESTPTPTGLWKLNPASGALTLLDHSPSGDFHPIVDSFGRVIFTRWDHLQRDQQKDAGSYGTFDYSGEDSNSVPTDLQVEIFPEPRSATDPAKKSFETLHTMNHFFPWMMHQDGTELETLNHVGRHELAGYGAESRNDDSNLTYLGNGDDKPHADLLLHLREDPIVPGKFFAIKAPEFGTHAAGQIISLLGAPSVNAADMAVTYVTHPDTSSTSDSPTQNHSGLYRTPLMTSTGELIASHTTSTKADRNEGTSTRPLSRYQFRLSRLQSTGTYYSASTPLTPGIRKTVSYWQPDYLIQYEDQELWELQPVELIARVRPPLTTHSIPTIEREVLSSLGVDLTTIKEFLRSRNLGLIVMRDVTARDAADRQQPFNLRVAGTEKKKLGAGGKVYDISSFQILQGDLLRGIGGADSPRAGRRVLARTIHGVDISNGDVSGLPEGAVRVASDGSVAAFVPANRALSWQLLAPNGDSVVRERFWLTVQPGEIRVCTGCHGANRFDQSGAEPPSNSPEALATLLRGMTFPPPQTSPRTYSLSIIKRGKQVRALTRGDAYAIKVKVTGEAMATPVTLSVFDGLCSGTVTTEVSAGGLLTRKGVVPFGKKRGALQVRVTVEGVEVAQQKLSLKAKYKALRRASPPCKGLLK